MSFIFSQRGGAVMFIFIIIAVAAVCAGVWYSTGSLIKNSEQIFNKDKRAQTLYVSGVEAIEKGDNEKAIAKFLAAIEIDKDFVEAHMRVGEVYKKIGKDVPAAKHFENCIKTISEKNVDIAKYVAFVNVEKDEDSRSWKTRYEKARDIYRNILEFDKTHKDVYLPLAEIYVKLKERSKAKYVLTQLIKLDPNSKESKTAQKLLKKI